MQVVVAGSLRSAAAACSKLASARVLALPNQNAVHLVLVINGRNKVKDLADARSFTLAPAAGLEPATFSLTARRSTTELSRNIIVVVTARNRGIIANLGGGCKPVAGQFRRWGRFGRFRRRLAGQNRSRAKCKSLLRCIRPGRFRVPRCLVGLSGWLVRPKLTAWGRS